MPGLTGSCSTIIDRRTSPESCAIAALSRAEPARWSQAGPAHDGVAGAVHLQEASVGECAHAVPRLEGGSAAIWQKAPGRREWPSVVADAPHPRSSCATLCTAHSQAIPITATLCGGKARADDPPGPVGAPIVIRLRPVSPSVRRSRALCRPRSPPSSRLRHPRPRHHRPRRTRFRTTKAPKPAPDPARAGARPRAGDSTAAGRAERGRYARPPGPDRQAGEPGATSTR